MEKNIYDECVRLAMLPADEGGSGLNEEDAQRACAIMIEKLDEGQKKEPRE